MSLAQNDVPTETVGRLFKASGNLAIVADHYQLRGGFPCRYRRGVIRDFSPGAGVRMRAYLRECVAEYRILATVTYPSFFSSDGRNSKRDLDLLLEWLRDQAPARDREKWSAFWFLEFQARGAPHYHILLTHPIDKALLARKWFDIVRSGDDRHLRAGTRIESIRAGRAGMISYVSKYAAKQEQKDVPEDFDHVGRWWGIRGLRSRVAATTVVRGCEMSDRNVKKWLDNSREFLANRVKSGDCRMLARKHGVTVFAFKHRTDAETWHSYVNLLAFAVAGVRAKWPKQWHIDCRTRAMYA